jgi:hypothetical protein
MELSLSVPETIASLNDTPKMKLLDWIDMNKLSDITLPQNPNAFDLFEKYPKKFKMQYFSYNKCERAMRMLEARSEKINYYMLSANPESYTLLEKKPEEMDWQKLIDENCNPLKLVEALFNKLLPLYSTEQLTEHLKRLNLIDVDTVNHKNITKFISDNRSNFTDEDFCINDKRTNWYSLSMNSKILDVLEAQPSLINWYWLSARCNSQREFDLLEKYPERISWRGLSRNPYPPAFALLEKNPDKINWEELSCNPNEKAINLLKNNPIKINWSYFSKNPSIFEIDTKN